MQTVSCARHILSGKVYLSTAMTERMLQQASGAEKAGGPPDERLSDRELMVFELTGQGKSTREVAEQLFLSVKTVETHKEHIKTKLGLKSGAELAREATRWVVERR